MACAVFSSSVPIKANIQANSEKIAMAAHDFEQEIG
jgi:hypothetical protein